MSKTKEEIQLPDRKKFDITSFVGMRLYNISVDNMHGLNRSGLNWHLLSESEIRYILAQEYASRAMQARSDTFLSFLQATGWVEGHAPDGVKAERLKYRTESGQWVAYHKPEETHE